MHGMDPQIGRRKKTLSFDSLVLAHTSEPSTQDDRFRLLTSPRGIRGLGTTSQRRQLFDIKFHILSMSQSGHVSFLRPGSIRGESGNVFGCMVRMQFDNAD